MSKQRAYLGPSDAQSNADALARRSTTYADEHARSWELRFSARDKPMTTKALVAELARMLADEIPTKLHEAADHIDGGGVPAMTHDFMAYLDGRPMDTTGREPSEDSQHRPFRPVIAAAPYRKPVQAAIEGMKRCRGRTAWWGRIAERVVISSEAPVMAAKGEGSHEHEAVRTANEALFELYRRVTPDKMALGRTEAAA